MDSHRGMKVGAIVQARMNSDRLPGKVLHPVRGKPMLEYILERLDRCALLNRVVVATSTDRTDDPVERFCRERATECYRGSLSNVASRFKNVLDIYGFDAFVRVSGDSPLLDPGLVDRAVGIFLQGDLDLVTNVFPRSYPRGQSVEVVRTETFRRVFDDGWSNDEAQHVTPFFYRCQEAFRIVNFCADADYSGIHLAVDSVADMERFAAILNAMGGPHWRYGLEEILGLYEHVSSGGGSHA